MQATCFGRAADVAQRCRIVADPARSRRRIRYASLHAGVRTSPDLATLADCVSVLATFGRVPLASSSTERSPCTSTSPSSARRAAAECLRYLCEGLRYRAVLGSRSLHSNHRPASPRRLSSHSHDHLTTGEPESGPRRFAALAAAFLAPTLSRGSARVNHTNHSVLWAVRGLKVRG